LYMAGTRRGRTVQSIAVLGVFTALTTAATMFLSVSIPVTKGYFNIGETMVYTSALLFGPFIGAFTGGVGSMLADLFLGYVIYAPATLVVKGLEGFLVGFLGSKRPFKSEAAWRAFSLISGAALAVVVGYVGLTLYSGSLEATWGFGPWTVTSAGPEVPGAFWIGLAAACFVLVSYAGFKIDPGVGWVVIAVLIGGLEMVSGYFIYEQAVLGYYALAEVPINIGQASIGLLVSVPLTKAVKRAISHAARPTETLP